MIKKEIEIPAFPIKDWEILPVEIYTKLFDEVKEKFSLHFLETTNITQRSYNLLIAFSTFIVASGIYVFNKHGLLIPNIILGVCSTYNIISIFSIFKGHEIHYSGSDPNVITKDFEGYLLDSEKKQRLFYRNLIIQYHYKIIDMRSINLTRSSKYDNSVIISIIIAIVVACYLGSIW